MLLNLKTSLQVGETVWPSTPSSTHTSKSSVEDLCITRLEYTSFFRAAALSYIWMLSQLQLPGFFSDRNYFDLKASCKTITERILITLLMWPTKNFLCRSCLTLQVREFFYRSLFFLIYWVANSSTFANSSHIWKRGLTLKDLKSVVGGTSITDPSSSLVK